MFLRFKSNECECKTRKLEDLKKNCQKNNRKSLHIRTCNVQPSGMREREQKDSAHQTQDCSRETNYTKNWRLFTLL